MEKVTVLLADESPLIRTGLSMVLMKAPNIEVIHETGQVQTICEAYQRLSPNVVVMDIVFQGETTGLDAISDILEYDHDAAIVVLTQDDQARLIQAIYKLGAKSFVPKNTTAELLVDAIKKAADGEKTFLPGIAQTLADFSTRNVDDEPEEMLTEREFGIYKLIAADRTTPEIAKSLELSEKSVSNALYNLKQKLGLSRTTEIIKHAIKHGVISLD